MSNEGYRNLKFLLSEHEVNLYSNFNNHGSLLELFTGNSVWPNGAYYFTEDVLNDDKKTAIRPQSNLVFVAESESGILDLKMLGYRFADFWYSMILNLNDCDFSMNSPQTELIELQTDLDLCNWIRHTERVFFRGDVLNKNIFSNMVGNDKFEIVNIYFYDNVIGQALLYYNKRDVGLYFFTIYESFRKRGLANDALIQICISLQRKGFNRLALQSTGQGKQLYLRNGFQQEERILIFKKI